MTLMKRSAWLASLLLLLGGLNAFAANEPGLVAKISVGSPAKAFDFTVLPNVWLYVPSGQPVSPFVPGGENFTVEWTGFLTVDLRADYQFEFELNGQAKLEINGKVVK